LHKALSFTMCGVALAGYFGQGNAGWR